MSKKPTVLMILDGFGLNDKTEGNAIAQANTPTIDKLMKEYPFVKGYASGLAVGLSLIHISAIRPSHFLQKLQMEHLRSVLMVI